MSFKVGRLFAAALIVSVLIQTQITLSGYAARGIPGIAFTSTRDGNSEIYVMDSDGGNQVRLTEDPARDYHPAWSPDGNRIAFVSDRDDGHKCIFVMDSKGRNLKQLTRESNDLEPAWSPDGAKIAFTRNKGGRQIWVMDADGGNQIRLTNVGMNYQPVWWPYGGRIAFTSHVGGSGIFAMGESGNNREKLVRDWAASHPSWSPDGQWIAYESLQKEQFYQIYAARIDSSGFTKKLTRNEPHKRYPVWSPDGDKIAYVSAPVFQNTTIHVMTARGKHLKQLSEEHFGSDTDPDWYAPVGWSVSPVANFVTMWGEIKTPASGR